MPIEMSIATKEKKKKPEFLKKKKSNSENLWKSDLI